MSLSQSQIKLVRALGQKKFRQKYQYFTAEGDKIARDILTHKTYGIHQVFALSSWIEANQLLLQAIHASVFEITPKQLKQISFLKTPNDVMIVLKMPKDADMTADLTSGLHFYLDDIRDPGNMGTIIRIALWFGFESVLASPSCVDFYNQKVVQATMGAFLHLPLITTSLTAIDIQQPMTLVSTEMNGVDMTKQKALPKDAMIIIGNEGSGVSQANSDRADLKISIPSFGENEGKIDSLNAAVSAGIIASYFSK